MQIIISWQQNFNLIAGDQVTTDQTDSTTYYNKCLASLCISLMGGCIICMQVSSTVINELKVIKF